MQQNAFDGVDTFTPLDKQYTMMTLVLDYYDEALKGLDKGLNINDLVALPIREAIGRLKYVEVDKVAAEYERIKTELAGEIDKLVQKMQEEAI